MTLYDAVKTLRNEYKHTELWFYSGMGETEPSEVAINVQNWKWPKILKRNGRAVAEFTGRNNKWELIGDYKTPHNDPCSPPGESCLFNDYLEAQLIFNNY